MIDVAHQCPLAYYAFIKMKLASRHLLLYVVYTCQKSFNFINVFANYKQKCKLANLICPTLYVTFREKWLADKKQLKHKATYVP